MGEPWSLETLVVICLIGNSVTAIILGLVAWIDWRLLKSLNERMDRLEGEGG